MRDSRRGPTEAELLAFVHWHMLEHFRRPENQPLRARLAAPWRVLGFALVSLLQRLRPAPGASQVFRAVRSAAGRTLYYFSTLNQRDALSRVAQLDGDAVRVAARRGVEAEVVIDTARLRRHSHRYARHLLRAFLRGDRATRLLLADEPRRFVRMRAEAAVFEALLRELQPRLVVLANDHNRDLRVLMLACRAAGVPTVYLQHAAVSDRFPPLATDWALLDGMDAREKYRAAGPSNTRVALVGIPKFSGTQARVNTRAAVTRVGICLKVETPGDAALALAAQLRAWQPAAEVVLRTHPRLRGAPLEELEAGCRRQNFRLSAGGREGSDVFLTGVDLIIAGNSSVLLDAALLNVVPVYYQGMDPAAAHRHRPAHAFCYACYWNWNRFDYYGFVARGLCLHAPDAEALRARLAEATAARPPVRTVAKWYCDTIDTPWDFRSDALAAECIRRIAAGQDLPLRPAETFV